MKKTNKMPEFCMTFARKMPEIYMTIDRNLMSDFFREGGGHVPRPPPSPTLMHDSKIATTKDNSRTFSL